MWTMILWTDQDNRDLVSKHYPWLLDVFDKLPGIHQADMVRISSQEACSFLMEKICKQGQAKLAMKLVLYRSKSKSRVCLYAFQLCKMLTEYAVAT